MGIKYREIEANLPLEFKCPDNYPTEIKANYMIIKY